MKRASTIFLQTVIVLIGLVALILLLREPWTEGVNANAASFSQVYFDDPFLAIVYLGSVPFFIGLFQAFNLLGFIGRNKTFSEEALKCLRTIKWCALSIIGFVAVEEVFIMLNHSDDDAVGGVMMGVFITFGSIVIATAAAVFERMLQSAVDLKVENDLTV